MQTEENAVPQEDVTPTEEQAQQPAETTSESGTETPTETGEAAPQQPKTWAERRIDKLTWEKNEERRQREALEAQLRQYQQPADQSQPPAEKPLTADQIRAEAKRLLEQERFDDACNKTFEAGKKEFPDFEKSLRTFGMLGGAPQEFLEVVTEMDAGHKVIHHLGANPEEAERLLSLPPLRMARELARLETSLSKAPPVSKAPPPISPVGGRAAPPEPSDFASTADYIAWRKANRK
ncbi:hypothetical protein R6138_04365 [Ralstonia thomasii]|uniref:hypothetical protein n=1 Tax=Ralstonia thomasii TaxID=3058596 RepID=UPI0028F6719E|nr:hypothetical protein [Ralstonia sp. LMG 18095]CAJ0899715.1 hypothetical protein R6138_04365 [Ralstonia sp. LMG 18095]